MYAKKHSGTKVIATLLAIALLIGGTIGGTLAWLATNTKPVVNTFTTSDINIKLEETTTDFKMVPGVYIDKDPKVTVEAKSEACYLFVKVEEAGGDVTVGNVTYKFGDFIAYAMAGGWITLPNEEGVFYREVSTSENNQEFSVLANDKVQVLNTVTKEMMDAVDADENKKPTLTFTAYAVQQEGLTVEQAWAQANTLPEKEA